MNYVLDEDQNAILDGITRQIRFFLAKAAMEQYTPDSDSDKSDAHIADAKERAAKLRVVRASLEEIFTGVLL